MDVRAAVATGAGKPLEVMTVQLEGPKAFEVLVEIKATGICHTDEFTLSGADPEGLFPAILGHEGAGVVVEVGRGVTTGIGAVLNTAKVEPGAKGIVFGLGGIGLNVIQGLRLAGADMIIGVDLNNDRKQWGERFGMTHFVNPKDLGAEIVPHLVNMTKQGADQIGGADYSFDCT